MIQFKKNKAFATIEENLSIIMRATPQDAVPGDTSKNFYIVDLIRRPGRGGVAYQIETKIIDFPELCRLMGVKKREKIKWI